MAKPHIQHALIAMEVLWILRAAYDAGEQLGIDPLLLLAVMAIVTLLRPSARQQGPMATASAATTSLTIGGITVQGNPNTQWQFEEKRVAMAVWFAATPANDVAVVLATHCAPPTAQSGSTGYTIWNLHN